MYEAFEQDYDQLDPAVRWELQQIEGYLQLRMAVRARRALAQLPGALEHTGMYRAAQMHLAFTEEDWKNAAQHAARLVEDYPRHSEFWIQWAYALRRVEGLEEAEKVLLKGLKNFPGDAVFHYNLGCYAAVLGNPEQALDHLDRAFELEDGFRRMALDDEDLKTIWPMLEPE